MGTDRRAVTAVILLVLSLVGFILSFLDGDAVFISAVLTVVATILLVFAIAQLIKSIQDYGRLFATRRFLIIAGVVILIPAYLLVSIVSANARIAGIANDLGRKYGVTDFKSRSTIANGTVWRIELYSDDFDRLAAEDRFNLMVSIGASKKMQSTLVEEIENYTNPLMGPRFIIRSGGDTYKVYTNDESDTISAGGHSEKGIEEHGYRIQSSNKYGGSSSAGKTFTNKYGTAKTKCAHSGCSSYIASSGDTNCCTKHSNRCGNCRCYIDEDALFCMSCIKKAMG